jgi:hypothetical protein
MLLVISEILTTGPLQETCGFQDEEPTKNSDIAVVPHEFARHANPEFASIVFKYE